MLPRFYVPGLDPNQADLTLPATEAHHLHRVLRVRAGEDVIVFDGRGTSFRARVASIGRDRVAVVLQERLEEPPRATVRLTLVPSVLKGDAMDDVVRDCTMVGVEAIQPIVSARSTVKTSVLPKAVERWRRIALAAAKQCGRSSLPEIGQVLLFDEWIDRDRGADGFILVEPEVQVPAALGLREIARRPAPPAATLIVGPEGGWTMEERDRAISAGCTPLSLGGLTLRAERVPLVAAVSLLAVWDARQLPTSNSQLPKHSV